MTRTDQTRSLFLVALVALAAVVGAVAVTGTVGAQDAGNETGTNTSDTNVEESDVEDANTDESFYSPSEEDPLNARFRNCCGETVESVAEGVLNLNIVYGMFDGAYDVEITASGLSEEQVEDITFDDPEYDTEDLSRTDIVGMNFTGVPAGEYVFTVSVVGEDASETVPLEVLGEEATDEPAANESATNETTEEPTTNETTNATTEMGNETELGTGEMAPETDGNVTVTAVPSAPNTTANYTISTVIGPNATGNLTQITINYRESNASIGVVTGTIQSATLGGQSIINNTTVATIGPFGRNLTIGFDETIQAEQGERLNITFGGITNPPEPGTYTVGVRVNNGTFDNVTLAIGQNTTGNATEMGATQMANATGNTSITAMPSAANTTANHTVSTVIGPNATGNLTQITINYRESNVSIGVITGNIRSATLSGESIVNTTTVATIGPFGRNLTIGFDGTIQVSEGDRLNITYGGVTNPPEPGTYTVGVRVNNGTFDNATLNITQNTTAGNETTTETPTPTQTTTTGTQTTTTGGTTPATAAETAAGTGGGSGSGGGQQGTEAGGPGFGVAVAIVALLAAALLATRRN